MPARRTSARRGFTLVELMVVVVIAGVLVTLAVIGVRKYVYSAKTSEAIHMLTSIAAAQESYKEEVGVYLKASSSATAYYPQGGNPGKTKWHWINDGHADYPKWRQLSVVANEPVQFGYVALAGSASEAIPNVGTTKSFSGSPTGGPWMILVATGDQDGDGDYSKFVMFRSPSAESAGVYMENEAE